MEALSKCGPHAFLFNADSPNFNGYYGYPCNKKLFDAVLENDDRHPIFTRIFSGDLMLHQLCSQIEAVARTGNSSSTTYSVNEELYLTILAEFSLSLQDNANTIKEKELHVVIAKNNIYAIVLTNLSYTTRLLVDESVRNLNGYIGMVELDIRNPLHIILFIENMVDHGYLKSNTLFLCDDFCDREDIIPAWATENVHINTRIIPNHEFKKQAPPLIIPPEFSKHGERFRQIMTLKGKTDHYQKIAIALLENEDTEFHYTVNGRLSYEKITVPQEKLTKYALNFEHQQGGKEKAKQFKELLGIETKDWRYVAAQIENNLAYGRLCKVRKTEFGIQYHIDIPIIGLNEKSKTVRTAWITKEDGENRLTTLYIAKEKEQQDIQGTHPNVIQASNLCDFWPILYNIAHTEAKKIADNYISTPMFIQGYAPIIDGTCGYAWVVVKDARTGFAKWLKDNKIGFKHYKSGWQIFVSRSDQSYEKAKLYAETFERVLKQNGIDCYVESRLD